MQVAVGEKPKIWGTSIVGFGSYQYAYASGREGDWMRIGFSVRKAVLSVYLTCNLDELASFLAKLGTYKRGVGCLYMKRLADVDMTVLKKMIASVVKQTAPHLER